MGTSARLLVSSPVDAHLAARRVILIPYGVKANNVKYAISAAALNVTTTSACSLRAFNLSPSRSINPNVRLRSLVQSLSDKCHARASEALAKQSGP